MAKLSLFTVHYFVNDSHDSDSIFISFTPFGFPALVCQTVQSASVFRPAWNTKRQTFHISRAEVLSVLLQSFPDVLLVLHLDEGLSGRPPHPVHSEMDPLCPVMDPTL